MNLKKRLLLVFVLNQIIAISFLYSQESIDSNELIIGQSLYRSADIIYEIDADSAFNLIIQANLHFEKSRSWEDYVQNLNVLATIANHRGEMDLFKNYAILAANEAEQKLSNTHPLYAKALNNLNTYYFNIGDFKASVELLKKSLVIKKKNKALPLNMSYTYNNVGTTLVKRGDYKEALIYLKKSLEIRQNVFESTPEKNIEQLILRAKLNIAWAYLEDDQFDLALSHYLSLWRESKELGAETSSISQKNIIDVLQNIARIHILNEDFDLALLRLNEVLLLQKGDKAHKKSYTLELLGDISFAFQNFEGALEYYEKALRITKVYGASSNFSDYSRKFIRIASVKKELKQFDEALDTYQNAQEVLAPGFIPRDPLKNPPPALLYSKIDALEIIVGKGEVYWEKYQESKDVIYLTKAHHTFVYGVKLIKAIREGVVTKEAKNNLAEKTVLIYEGAIRTALEYNKNKNDKGSVLEAFALAESNKSMLLLESLNEQTAFEIKELPDSLLQKDRGLRLEIAYYQKQIIESHTEKEQQNSKTQELKNQLFNLKTELQALTDHFEETYPRFYNLKYQEEKVNIPEWQKKLAANNQALIEYFVGEEKIYVFTLWGEGCKVFEIEKLSDVFQSVKTFRDAINQVPEDDAVLQNYQDITSAGYYLYQNILEPALKVLPDNIHRLKIIPDNQFNYVPFDLLLTEAAPQDKAYFSAHHLEYVLKKYQVSYDYSATWMFKGEKNNNVSTKNFIAYAPSFKEATSIVRSRSCEAEDLFNLECSEKEVRSINNLLNGETRIGSAANTADFIQEATDYRIIHMATHACVDEENPSFNKIFLTDDYLSNADLYNTSLNAELVVLSACNTGSGKLVKGEGVLSLARGFVQAGCRSSIVSRWSVDDCATSEIMQYFYEGLERGEEKDEALRLAKLNYLKEADQFYAHPYYWSAFVGYGDMGAMDLGGSFWWKILIGVSLMGLLLLEIRTFR